MIRVIAAVALLVFTVYCIVDAVQSDEHQVRGLPKILWILLVLIFPLAGGLAWLIAGRPKSILDVIFGDRDAGRGPRGPLGPDDDPDFLRGI